MQVIEEDASSCAQQFRKPGKLIRSLRLADDWGQTLSKRNPCELTLRPGLSLSQASCKVESMPNIDAPRSLCDPANIAARRRMLMHPHVAPLTGYVENLRAMGRGEVPDFDPRDGGTAAQVLFLFEKPGPMTDPAGRGARAGSGFISRDNDDPTAEATFRFLQEADLPRRLTLTWNVVPWWNGTRRITAEELRSGVAALHELLEMLPDLRAVVLVGRKAARSARFMETKDLHVIESAHPSPIVRATRPGAWSEIPGQWSKVRAFLKPAD